MDILHQQVAIARRRLVLQQFFGTVVWCWFATLMVAAVAIAVQKLFLQSFDAAQWATWWVGGAIGGGLITAIIWTWAIRRRDLDAAIEIDHRFGLKERVSSALALGSDEIETPFGQALLDDTLRRVSRIDVGEKFPVVLGRNSWLPLVPAAVTAALFFFFNPTRSAEVEAKATAVAVKKHINESTKPLLKKVEERKKEAAEKGLKDAENLFNKLEEGTRDLKKNDGDRNQALTKLNDLAKELDKRREKLAEGEKLKQQLAQMKNLPAGPADKMAQALKNGDFDKAIKELQNLKDQLADGKLDPEKQKQLAEQMNAMKDALQKMADAHTKKQEELEKQIEKAEKAGDKEGAQKMKQELDKLAGQKPQMDMMKDLAQKLGQCAQCMKDGDGAKAQAGMAEMAKQLGELQQQAQEMAMLEGALDEIQEAKDAMNCKECGGEGCKACRGGGGNNKKGQGGDGLGAGEGGFGERPENAHDTKTYDSRVRQNVGRGAAVVAGLVDGPNAKGQAIEEIKTQVESAKKEQSDPLTGQRLPRQQRDHVQEYFDKFRNGK
jgi:hypothetical protein